MHTLIQYTTIPTGGISCRSAPSNRTVGTFRFNMRQSKAFEISVRLTDAESLQRTVKNLNGSRH